MSPEHLRTSSALVKTSVAEDAIVRHAWEIVSLGAFVTQFFEASLCVEWVLLGTYDLVLEGIVQDTACNNHFYLFRVTFVMVRETLPKDSGSFAT